MNMRWFVDTWASLRMMTEMYQSEEADEEYKRKGWSEWYKKENTRKYWSDKESIKNFSQDNYWEGDKTWGERRGIWKEW